MFDMARERSNKFQYIGVMLIVCILSFTLIVGFSVPISGDSGAEKPQYTVNSSTVQSDSSGDIQITDESPSAGSVLESGETTFDFLVEYDMGGAEPDYISISIGEDQYEQPQKEIDISSNSDTESVTMTETVESHWDTTVINVNLWEEGSTVAVASDTVEYSVGTGGPVADIDCLGPYEEGTVFDCYGGQSTSPGGTIVEYEWSFQGSVRYGEIAEFVPDESGHHPVELTVTDDSGDTDTETEIIEVEEGEPDEPPEAAIDCDDPVQVGETMTCDGSASHHPDGEIDEYEWTLGDGTVDDGSIVTHTYDDTGSYVIELTVVGDHGLEGTDTQVVEVNPSEPEITDVTVPPTTQLGDPAQLSVSADDPGGLEPLTYEWDIDGYSDTGSEVEFDPSTTGTLSGTVTVTNTEGEYATESFSFEVLGEPPEINSISLPSTVSAGEAITGTASATDPDGLEPLEYSWEINGQTFTGESISFTPDEAGLIQGELTVTNSADVKSTSTFTISVETEPLELNVDEPSSVTSDSITRFPIQYQNPNAGQLTATLLVNDDQVDSAIDSGPSGSVQLSHSFDPGTKLVEIALSDEFGEETVERFEVDVEGQEPIIEDFSPAESHVGVSTGEAVEFDVEASDPDGEQTDVQWYVDGDLYQQGGTSIDRTFSETGATEVRAVVVNEAGLETARTWTVQSDSFRESPRFTDHSTAQQVDLDGDSPILTFSFRNVEANHRTAIVEIRAETPDGIVLAGAQNIEETDGAQSVITERIEPGNQEHLSLSIDIADDSLEGSTEEFVYEIIYYPEEDTTETITVEESSVELQIGDSTTSTSSDNPPQDGNEGIFGDETVSDEVPGFGVMMSVVSLVVFTALLKRQRARK